MGALCILIAIILLGTGLIFIFRLLTHDDVKMFTIGFAMTITGGMLCVIGSSIGV